MTKYGSQKKTQRANLQVSKLINLTLIILFAGFLSITAQAKQVIKAIVGNYPPYIDQYAQTKGIVSQIVEQSLKLSGVKIEFEFDEWQNIENRVTDEKVLSFMWVANPQREKNWLFSAPVYQTKIIVVANKKARMHWQRYDQLRSYRLGLTKGYSYGQLFDEYKKYLNYHESISDFVNLKNLVADKYDGTVVEQLMGQYLIGFLPENKRQQLEMISQPFIHSANYYLVCARGYSKCYAYIDAFNQGLKKLKAQGMYSKILNL